MAVTKSWATAPAFVAVGAALIGASLAKILSELALAVDAPPGPVQQVKATVRKPPVRRTVRRRRWR